MPICHIATKLSTCDTSVVISDEWQMHYSSTRQGNMPQREDEYITAVTIVEMEVRHGSVTPQTLIIINKCILKIISKWLNCFLEVISFGIEYHIAGPLLRRRLHVIEIRRCTTCWVCLFHMPCMSRFIYLMWRELWMGRECWLKKFIHVFGYLQFI